MVFINGNECDAAGLTVAAYLRREHIAAERVAVEINEEIVAKSDYDNVRFNDGDRVEIVRFVGGG